MSNRIKLFFMVGVGLLVLASALAAWSLSQLRTEVQIRKESTALQIKLDDVIYELQEADNSLLVFKMTNSQVEFNSFLGSLAEVQGQLHELVEMTKSFPEITDEIIKLQGIMEEKIRLTEAVVLQHSGEPTSN